MVISTWREGWRRVLSAPAVALGVFGLTLVLALPLALSLRGQLGAHLGRSAMSIQAAEGVDYDWWQEFTSQASGLGTTFTPAIVGFAATLDNIGSVADGQAEIAPVAGAIALYLAAWTFITGGVIDRYARQRKTRALGFFAASGVFFFRFLRLAIVAGLFYWWMFTYVHQWLLEDWYRSLTRELSEERTALAIRAALYAAFGVPLLLANLVFDYAKIRAVVEDRRSAVGALAAAVRFIRRHPAAALGLYAINTASFLALLAVWAIVAPGAAAGPWVGVLLTQAYIGARLLLKLQFLASQTSLFQSRLAHAAYTAAPVPAWPDSPAAEAIRTPASGG